MADTRLSNMRHEEFAPRKLEDFFAETWRIYKANFGTLWGISALVVIFQLLYMGVWMVLWIFFGAMSGANEIMIYLPFVIAGGFFFFAVWVIATLWVRCALTHVVFTQYTEREVSFTAAFGQTWGKFGTVILSQLLVGLVTGALFITIIGIPFSVYFSIAWSFVIPVILLEQKGVTEAMKRSHDLIKDNWWRIFGIVLLFWLIGFSIHLMVGLVPLFGSLAATLIVMPIGVIVSTLLYLDLRVRKEHYSRDLVEQELGSGVR